MPVRELNALALLLLAMFAWTLAACGGSEECPAGQTSSDGRCVTFAIANFRGCITGQVRNVSSEDRFRVEAALNSVIGKTGAEFRQIDTSSIDSQAAVRIIDICEKYAQPAAGAAPVTGINNAPIATTDIALSACRLTIDNPLVALREEPTPGSRELIRLKTGKYDPPAYVTNTFAGRKDLWFKINAQGRTGWIMDSTFNIEAKSSGCP